MMLTLRKAFLFLTLLIVTLFSLAFNANVTLADDDTTSNLTFTKASTDKDGDLILPEGVVALTSPNTQDSQVPACAVKAGDREPSWEYERMPFTPCVGGMAGSFQCENVDLMSALPLNQIGGGQGNDIWGWTDPTNNREYALVGRTNGTAFVDVTDATAPVYLGNLPSHTGSSIWRDIKVYNNHAFIVSDSNGNHGMQVFDLNQLRDVPTPPVTFTETAHYSNIGSSHNIAINEATGYAYIIGGSSGTETCAGGLHMVNIQNPASPAFAGCYADDGYTHDTQCVVYNGPDTEHQGAEICFSSNEDTLTITDVSDKSDPVLIARQSYQGASYSHQGWLTEDHQYFLMDDELDEGSGAMTATYIWDLTNLESPVNTGTFMGSTTAIDHNQYVKGDYSYQANYRAGLRILDISNIENAQLSEYGYFDIYPANNNASFNGAWSNYPYFASGNVIVNGIEQGLVVVRPNLPVPTAVEVASLTTAPAATNSIPMVVGLALVGITLVGFVLRRR
jgi:choice-of-anchor B domain-containing protein